MADTMKATPPRPEAWRRVAGGLNSALKFAAAPFGYQNPPVQFLLDNLATGVQPTLERMQYGDRLATGTGMTTRPLADTADAFLNVVPGAYGAVKVASKAAKAAGKAIAPARLVGGYSGEIPIDEFVKNAERFSAAVPQDRMPLYHATSGKWEGGAPNPGTWFSTEQPYAGNPFGDTVRAYTIPRNTVMTEPMQRGGDFWTKLGQVKEPVALIDDSGVTSYVVQDPSILQRLEINKRFSLLD
jgi:hypothetical protein